MTIEDAVHRLGTRLAREDCGTPRLDAEVIVAFVLGVERFRLITEAKRELSVDETDRIEKAGDRRVTGEPVAYITGRKEFYSLDFMVDRRVLVPRPETELLVDLVLYHAPGNADILDLCTGSGAVAVAVKHNRKDCRVSATDLSLGALDVARRNADELLGPGEVGFFHGDLYDAVAGMTFDVIVANPPYIDPEEKPVLPRELGFEPEDALYCGDRGRAVIYRIIDGGREYLRSGGVMIIEMGATMENDVITRARERGFGVTVARDYSGLPRAALLKG